MCTGREACLRNVGPRCRQDMVVDWCQLSFAFSSIHGGMYLFHTCGRKTVTLCLDEVGSTAFRKTHPDGNGIAGTGIGSPSPLTPVDTAFRRLS